MSNEDIEHLDFETPDPEDGDEGETERPDPTEVARLDQEQQAYNDNVKSFANTYGFVHECRCAEDVAEGKTRDVPECFLGMVSQAMAACAVYYQENRQLRVYLQQMLQMNEDLAKMVKEHGGEDDLEKYFTEEFEQQEASEDTDVEDVARFEDEGGPSFNDADDSDDDDDNLAIA